MTGVHVTLLSVFPLLLRRRRAILISGLAAACLAFAMSRVIPLQYASEGNVVVESHDLPNADTANPTIVNGVSTQIDVLRSKGLIRSALDDIPMVGLVPKTQLPSVVLDWLTAAREAFADFWRILDNKPGNGDATEDIVTYIQKHLSVEAKDNSSVISVQFTAGTPDSAAAVVNAIMSRYIATVAATRDAEAAKADQWINEQMAGNRREVTAAEQRVSQFVQEHHNLAEVQGSLTAAIQLSRDQDQLTIAQEELAKQQAALDTVIRSGSSAAEETLTSKSIQNLKELEAKTIEQYSALASYDPRRRTLQDRINGIRTQIDHETKLIPDSIARNVQIARARVQALEAAVQRESVAAQNSTVAGASLRQLTNDLEAKRQLYVAFLTRASQARLAALQAPSARILFQATPQLRPVHSFGLVSILLGLISGVIAASGIIVTRSTLSLSINSTSELAALTGLPVLGSLPDFNRKLLPPHTAALVTETFRAMWITMRSSQDGGTAILVTSSEANEGKSTVAATLARRLSDDGSRVLLVDGDLRHPRLARVHGLQPENHLESVLRGTATLEESVASDPRSGLHLLLADGSLDNPVRALASERFARLLEAGRRTYDFVILDSPPVLRVADPILMARACQFIIFVVEAGRVTGGLVNEATRRFSATDRSKILTLLTHVRPANMDNGDYYSGYRLTGT